MSLARLLLAALVLCGAPAVACADAAAEARFHDELGRRAYASRRFEDALSHFLDAHAAAPSATSLYNIALTAELARRDVLAFHFFEDYLASGDDDGARREVASSRRERLAQRLALVRIESDPPGASIAVDRDEAGDWGTTPRTIAVPPGTRRIVLRSADLESVELTVEASVGERRELRATLAARTGRLVVDAEPAGARVLVSRDGVLLAETSPGVAVSVPAGLCDVRVEHPGHRPAETTLRVDADTEARARLAATPLPVPRGRLLVRTTGGEARVLVDGRTRGVTPLALSEPVGRRRVALTAPGYLPWARDVEVREGRSTSVTVTLTPSR